jgi:hypothetical protein
LTRQDPGGDDRRRDEAEGNGNKAPLYFDEGFRYMNGVAFFFLILYIFTRKGVKIKIRQMHFISMAFKRR